MSSKIVVNGEPQDLEPMITSYGYQCLSLRGFIQKLQAIAEQYPDAADSPVWICHRDLYRPANNVSVTFNPDRQHPVALKVYSAGML